MTIHALGTLGSIGDASTVFTPAAPRALPSRGALEAEIRTQRLRLVAVFSRCLAVAGIVWGVGQGIVALDDVANAGTRFLVSLLQSMVLASGGLSGIRYCRAGRLRHAAYSNVAALLLSGSINLAFIRNAEGAAVVAYAAAVGLAALVIQEREWLWWGAILLASTLTASLLHCIPVLPQFDIPSAMASTGLVFATTLGLGVPAGLFWLFSHDLTASHERAWTLAREADQSQNLVRDHAERLEQRTAQLQAKNIELNDFLYVVSHDLRAPLINLEGFARALQDSVAALDAAQATQPTESWPMLKTEIDESLEFIVRSAGKMDFLVQGLLELSRIDSRPHLTQPIDLGAQVAQIIDSLRYSIDTRGIAVRVDSLPVVIGDPVRISQVFANLIDNAIKYMKQDGPAAIHVGCLRRDGHARFFVSDTGIGIRPEDHAKIFRLFSRVGSPTVAGDGMGLTSVKKIVEKAGGRIWVESALGQGSTFWFTLPEQETAGEWEDRRGTRAATDQDSAG